MIAAGDLDMDARQVYWVPRADCEQARQAISDFLASTAMFPTMRASLKQAITELDVSKVREAIWPDASENARLVANLSSDLLPILMSEGERDSLKAVPALPPSIRNALEGGDPHGTPGPSGAPRGVAGT